MPPKSRPRYTSAPELPSGFLSGPEFAGVLEFLQTSGAFALVADRKIDWARYQQEWQALGDGEIWVLDYPFERQRGAFRRKSEHPTAHLMGE